MTNAERISAVFTGEDTDRRAIILTLSLYGARLTSCGLYEYYTKPVEYVRGQRAIKESFNPDLLFAPFSLPLLGAAFGSDVQYYEDQVPNLGRPAISSIKQIDRLKLPNINNEPHLTYLRESVRRLAGECENETPVGAIVLSPMDLPLMIMGMELWLETVMLEPEATERILSIMTTHFIELSNALLLDGASCLILPVPFTNPMLIPYATVKEVAIPAMRKALEQVQGPLILHHVGGKMNSFLELLCDLPNTVGFCVDSKDNLAESREIIGPDKVLLSGIDGPTLYTRSHEDIHKECISILMERKDDKGFIFTTTSADIPLSTPPENIHAIRSAAEEYALKETT